MSATELVTIQHERAKAPRQERISRSVRRAIDHMVFDGLHRREAAQSAGIADHTLYQALRKPSVLAYLNSQQGVLRTSAMARTLAKAEQLMDGAESEHVQLSALQYISPNITRTENVHVHQHLIPGLTVVRAGWDKHDPSAHLIDGQAHEVRTPHVINRIGTPVPHPDEGNALESRQSPGDSQVPAKAPRGEK